MSCMEEKGNEEQSWNPKEPESDARAICMSALQEDTEGSKPGSGGCSCASERTVWKPYLRRNLEGRSHLQYYCV